MRAKLLTDTEKRRLTLIRHVDEPKKNAMRTQLAELNTKWKNTEDNIEKTRTRMAAVRDMAERGYQTAITRGLSAPTSVAGILSALNFRQACQTLEGQDTLLVLTLRRQVSAIAENYARIGEKLLHLERKGEYIEGMCRGDRAIRRNAKEVLQQLEVEEQFTYRRAALAR